MAAVLMEPGAKVLVRIADWLKRHPVRPRGDVQPQFALTPVPFAQPARPDFLLRQDGQWYVRWPNGSRRWETEASLRGRGFALPPQPLFDADDEVFEDGDEEPLDAA